MKTTKKPIAKNAIVMDETPNMNEINRKSNSITGITTNIDILQ